MAVESGSNRISMETIEAIFKGRKPGALGKHRFFSVLVPIVEKEGQLYLLYEVRADELKRQPGEICFPGGAMEEGETKRQCAVRETCEELGIRKKDIQVIGELDTLYAYSNFTMYSFVGKVNYGAVCHAKLNRNEVKEIFLVPLDELLAIGPFIYNMEIKPDIGPDFPYKMLNLNNGYNWRKGHWEVPAYTYGDRVIWGLTARVTHNLAEVAKGEKKG